jgi:hypothetical protein
MHLECTPSVAFLQATFTSMRLSEASRPRRWSEIMLEPIRRTETRDTGLSTADLANLNESGSTTQEFSDRNDAAQDSRIQTNGFDSQKRDLADGGTASRNRESSNERTNDRTEDLKEIEGAPLFSSEETQSLHSRWDAIQVSFVDEPRQAVQQADNLVANAMKRLAEVFAEERSRLDQQWDRGGDVSTEDLRLALRRYRSFFGRILSI